MSPTWTVGPRGRGGVDLCPRHSEPPIQRKVRKTYRGEGMNTKVKAPLSMQQIEFLARPIATVAPTNPSRTYKHTYMKPAGLNTHVSRCCLKQAVKKQLEMHASEWLLRENVLKRVTLVFKQGPRAPRPWKCSCPATFIYFVLTSRRSLVVFPPLSLTRILWKCWVFSSPRLFPWVQTGPHRLSSLSRSQASLLCQLSLQLALYFKCFSSDGPNTAAFTRAPGSSRRPDAGSEPPGGWDVPVAADRASLVLFVRPEKETNHTVQTADLKSKAESAE